MAERYRYLGDPVAQQLRAELAAALQPPIDPAYVERCSDALADHVRNASRRKHGLVCLTERWDRSKPDLYVLVRGEDAAA